MSTGMGSGESGQDFDLNIAPIIDCFTVLIAFMLASASFLSIGILDAGVAAAGTNANEGAPPAVNITIELGEKNEILVKVSGKMTSSQKIHPIPKNGSGASGLNHERDWNYGALTRQLSELKNRWPDLSAVTLTAGDSIEYRDVVKTMEITRKTLPVVLLGGF